MVIISQQLKYQFNGLERMKYKKYLNKMILNRGEHDKFRISLKHSFLELSIYKKYMSSIHIPVRFIIYFTKNR